MAKGDQLEIKLISLPTTQIIGQGALSFLSKETTQCMQRPQIGTPTH